MKRYLGLLFLLCIPVLAQTDPTGNYEGGFVYTEGGETLENLISLDVAAQEGSTYPAAFLNRSEGTAPVALECAFIPPTGEGYNFRCDGEGNDDSGLYALSFTGRLDETGWTGEFVDGLNLIVSDFRLEAKLTEPSDLRVLPSEGGTQLSWTDNSSDETGFSVFRRLTDEDFELLGETQADETSFIDTNTSPDETYIYGVQAVRGVETGILASEPISASSSYTLSIIQANNPNGANGSGNIVSDPAGLNCGPAGGAACTQAFFGGTSIELTPQPQEGFAFGAWSGACTGDERCVVTLSEDSQVSAYFAPERTALAVSVSGQGSVTSVPSGINCGDDCREAYAGARRVGLKATPLDGNVFAGWGGACEGIVGSSCTVDLDEGAVSVSARFRAGAGALNSDEGGAPGGEVPAIPDTDNDTGTGDDTDTGDDTTDDDSTDDTGDTGNDSGGEDTDTGDADTDDTDTDAGGDEDTGTDDGSDTGADSDDDTDDDTDDTDTTAGDDDTNDSDGDTDTGADDDTDTDTDGGTDTDTDGATDDGGSDDDDTDTDGSDTDGSDTGNGDDSDDDTTGDDTTDDGDDTSTDTDDDTTGDDTTDDGGAETDTTGDDTTDDDTTTDDDSDSDDGGDEATDTGSDETDDTTTDDGGDDTTTDDSTTDDGSDGAADDSTTDDTSDDSTTDDTGDDTTDDTTTDDGGSDDTTDDSTTDDSTTDDTTADDTTDDSTTDTGDDAADETTDGSDDATTDGGGADTDTDTSESDSQSDTSDTGSDDADDDTDESDDSDTSTTQDDSTPQADPVDDTADTEPEVISDTGQSEDTSEQADEPTEDDSAATDDSAPQSEPASEPLDSDDSEATPGDVPADDEATGGS